MNRAIRPQGANTTESQSHELRDCRFSGLFYSRVQEDVVCVDCIFEEPAFFIAQRCTFVRCFFAHGAMSYAPGEVVLSFENCEFAGDQIHRSYIKGHASRLRVEFTHCTWELLCLRNNYRDWRPLVVVLDGAEVTQHNQLRIQQETME